MLENQIQEQQERIQLQKATKVHQYRKNISINTFMVIPFLSTNFYDVIFFAIYMIITVGLFVYKVNKYPFPQYAISMQAVLLTFFSLTHYMRYILSKQSIQQKQPKKIIQYIIITIFMVPLYVFQLRLQIYVLLVDFVLNWVGLGLIVLQIFAGIWVLMNYRRKKNLS